ncbi:MAG: TIGR03621 family F420-dependent LLM class oxidoreductase [Acidimicrobiales bacterium]
MHAFRFAVQVDGAPDAASWRDKVRRIEDLGYSAVFMPDHFTDQLAPMVALATAAEATTRLRVGTLVLGNDYRHPLVAAKEAATLDLLSEGRLELGIGAGWMRSDYDQSGMVLDDPAIRVSRLEEAITVMKALWSGRCDFEGEHYRVTGATGAPLPHQRPHPPLLIGGGSPRVLRLAGREADIVGLNPRLTAGEIGLEVMASIGAEHYDRRVDWVRQGAGDRFDDIEFQCLTFFVRIVDNGDEVMSQLAQMFQMDMDQARQVPLALVGSVDEVCEQIAARRERFHMSYWVVHEAEMEDFGPVVSRMTGS